MPVLECSCGMIMSVSIAKPRNMCIRCGGAHFRELERFIPDVKATKRAPIAAPIICAILSGSLSVSADLAPSATVAICSL